MGLLIGGLPLFHQSSNGRDELLSRQEWSILDTTLGLKPFHNDLRTGLQGHHPRSGCHQAAVFRIHDGPTSYRDHRRFFQQDFLQYSLFYAAEKALPCFGKDIFKLFLSCFLNDLIEINKGDIEFTSQTTTDLRLSCAHKTGKDDLVSMRHKE